jgi:hypothetical protein
MLGLQHLQLFVYKETVSLSDEGSVSGIFVLMVSVAASSTSLIVAYHAVPFQMRGAFHRHSIQ